mgnify:CR=1 FL=1
MPKASKFSPDEGLTIYDLKDNDAVHWEDNTKLGAKNIIPFPYAYKTNFTDKGVTFTYDDTGIVNVNNTSTGSVRFYLVNELNDFNPFDEYGIDSFILSNSGLNSSQVYIEVAFYNNTAYAGVAQNTSQSNKIVINKPSVTFDRITIYIVIASGQVLSNNKIYPMLRFATDTDDTFASPIMTNKDLTYNVKSVYGGKRLSDENNIIPFPYYNGFSLSGTNIEYNVLSDGSIKVNASQSSSTRFYLVQVDEKWNPYNDYDELILADLGDRSAGMNVEIAFFNGSTYQNKVYNTNNSAVVRCPKPTDITFDRINMYIACGNAVTDKVYKPVVSPAYNSEFQTQVMSNKNLTDLITKTVSLYDMGNQSQFKFPITLRNSGGYTYGLIIADELVYHMSIHPNAVTLRKIMDTNDSRTLTATFSNDILTITSSNTLYGGIHVMVSENIKV